MAPNKKTKVDFSTALKAQADKMAPKQEQRRDKSKETFEAFVNGAKVTIVRGGSTDAEWEAAKQSVVDRTTETKAEVDAAEMSEETGSVRKSKSQIEQETADKAAKEHKPKYDGKPTDLEYERPVKEPSGGKIKSLLDSWLKDISLGAVGDEKAVDSLADGSAAEGAAIANEPVQQPVTAQPASGGGFLKEVDARVFGDKPLVSLPSVEGFAGHVAGQVGQAAKGVGGALGMPNLQAKGQGLIQSGEASMLNAEQPVIEAVTPPPSSGAAAVPGQPLAQSQQDLSGSGSASLSMNIPGGFTPAKLDPQLEKDLAASRAITATEIENAKDVIGTQEVLKDAAIRAEGNRRLEVQKQMEVEAGLAADAKRRSVEEARRYSTARQQTLQLAREAAATPTDPNRYWNNKDAGQKAAAVIAGALFGFTGQGMSWLQRLDGLVEQDMRAQQADRASKVGALNAEASGLGEAGAEALRNGATEAEAYMIARQAKLEGLNSYLQQMTSETQNMDQKMRGAQMQVELSGRLNALDQEAMQLGQQKVNAENQVRFHNAQLQQEAFSIGAKALAGPNKDKLPPAQQGVIQAADAGLNALPALEEAIGNPQGKWSTAMWDQVVKNVPGSDPNNRAASAAVLNRIIFAGIDKSVINASDQKFLDALQADVGMASLRKPGALKTLRRLLTESRNSALRTAKGLGQDVGTLQETTGPAKLKTERAF